MSTGSAMERMLHEYDVCHCGDYRLQHDDRGCLICRRMPHPMGRCNDFRLYQVATEIPGFYASKDTAKD